MRRRDILKLGSLALIAPGLLLPKRKEAEATYTCTTFPDGEEVHDGLPKVYSPQAREYPEMMEAFLGPYKNHGVSYEVEWYEMPMGAHHRYLQYPIVAKLDIRYEHGSELYTAFLNGDEKWAESFKEQVDAIDPSELFVDVTPDPTPNEVGPIWDVWLLNERFRLATLTYWGEKTAHECDG